MTPRHHAVFSKPFFHWDENMQKLCRFIYGNALLTTSPASASVRRCSDPSRSCLFTDNSNGGRMAIVHNCKQSVKKAQTRLHCTCALDPTRSQKAGLRGSISYVQVRRLLVESVRWWSASRTRESHPQGAMPMPPCRRANAMGSLPDPQKESG